MEKTETCPGCRNHCPKGELKCEDGREFFQGGGAVGSREGRGFRGHEHGRHAAPDKTSLSGMLCFCGHKLHHCENRSELFATLSQEEQDALMALLTKLTENWQ